MSEEKQQPSLTEEFDPVKEDNKFNWKEAAQGVAGLVVVSLLIFVAGGDHERDKIKNELMQGNVNVPVYVHGKYYKFECTNTEVKEIWTEVKKDEKSGG